MQKTGVLRVQGARKISIFHAREFCSFVEAFLDTKNRKEKEGQRGSKTEKSTEASC